jgi:hypothetical protein
LNSRSNFFQSIGGSRQDENFLSRLFCACYEHSSDFAQCTLDVFWRACGIPGRTPDAKTYQCDYQPATPTGTRGRPDICLLPRAGASTSKRFPSVYLESKVQSPLGEVQLSRYKSSGINILVAITRNWPEVSNARLRALKVNTLRWQDICHALTEHAVKAGVDRFLCSSFRQYLEASGMAYRESISQTHLKQVARAFRKISSKTYTDFVPFQ